MAIQLTRKATRRSNPMLNNDLRRPNAHAGGADGFAIERKNPPPFHRPVDFKPSDFRSLNEMTRIYPQIERRAVNLYLQKGYTCG